MIWIQIISKLRSCRLIAVAMFCALTLQAQAAINCSVSSSGFTTVYSANISSDNLNQGTLTVTCTRNTTDPTSVSYAVGANDGLNPGPNAAITNQATSGPGAAKQKNITYELYTDSIYSSAWENTGLGNVIAGVVNFGTATAASATNTFYAKVFAGQIDAGADTFTDQVTLSLKYLSGLFPVTSPGSLGVTISNLPSCQLTSSPGPITLNYVSFQATNETGKTPYSVRCTNGVIFNPYLDSLNTTLVNGFMSDIGLNFTLSLSNPGNNTATGLSQDFTITATVGANQAGTCATGTCNGLPQTHTLIISY